MANELARPRKLVPHAEGSPSSEATDMTIEVRLLLKPPDIAAQRTASQARLPNRSSRFRKPPLRKTAFHVADSLSGACRHICTFARHASARAPRALSTVLRVALDCAGACRTLPLLVARASTTQRYQPLHYLTKRILRSCGKSVAFESSWNGSEASTRTYW